MYIAGIHVSNERLTLATEILATLTLFSYAAAAINRGREAFKNAEEKGGPLKTTPTTLVGKLITPFHGSVVMLPTLAYIIVVPLNMGVQPSFMKYWSLPSFEMEKSTVLLWRLAACLGLVGTWGAYSWWLNSIGQSYHGIGVG